MVISNLVLDGKSKPNFSYLTSFGKDSKVDLVISLRTIETSQILRTRYEDSTSDMDPYFVFVAATLRLLGYKISSIEEQIIL